MRSRNGPVLVYQTNQNDIISGMSSATVVALSPTRLALQLSCSSLPPYINCAVAFF
jgi:hypothetical protein